MRSTDLDGIDIVTQCQGQTTHSPVHSVYWGGAAGADFEPAAEWLVTNWTDYHDLYRYRLSISLTLCVR